MPSFIAELCDLASDHQSQGVVNTRKGSSLQVLLLAAFAPVLCILQLGHLTCFSWRWENWPSERRFSCAWVGSARELWTTHAGVSLKQILALFDSLLCFSHSGM